MQLSLIDRLRPYLHKAIAAVVVGFLAWLATVTGIDMINDSQLAEIITTLLVWIVVAILSVVFGKWINPSNAASAHLAKEHKIVAENLKQADTNTNSNTI